MNQFDSHLDVVAGHAHFCAFRKSDNASDVSCSEIELRSVVVEERCMTAAFILGQNVNLSGELVVAGNRTRLSNNLSTDDTRTVNTTKQNADVVAGFRLIQQLVEHFQHGL